MIGILVLIHGRRLSIPPGWVLISFLIILLVKFRVTFVEREEHVTINVRLCSRYILFTLPYMRLI